MNDNPDMNQDVELQKAHAEIRRLIAEDQSLSQRLTVLTEKIREQSIEMARQQRILEVGAQIIQGNKLPDLDPQVIWDMVEAAGEVAARRQAAVLAKMSPEEINQEARRQSNECKRQSKNRRPQ